MKPAIVVVAYDRPHALQRLLSSLEAADYPAEVPLVITLDRGESPEARRVRELAAAFEWRFGPKRVIEHAEHLGLLGHFWAAGRLSIDYDGIVLLEDDLTVAPPFYAFASQVLARYAADAGIGGACLYHPWFNGFTHLPFEPLHDGYDVYFAGAPYTQGLALTAEQWQRFDAWWQQNGPDVHPDAALHPAFLDFRGDEWFPAMAAYLAREGRYFCFPRVSLTTAWGDAGVHFDRRTDWFLAPVQLRGSEFRLPDLDASLALYDSFFEIRPDRFKQLAPRLPDVEFDVDLNATKSRRNLSRPYVLTTRPAKRAIAAYGLHLTPLESNVIQALPGSEISLAQVGDVSWQAWAGLEARRRLERQAWSRRRPSRRRTAALLFARGVDRLRRAGESLPWRAK